MSGTKEFVDRFHRSRRMVERRIRSGVERRVPARILVSGSLTETQLQQSRSRDGGASWQFAVNGLPKPLTANVEAMKLEACL